MDDVGTGYGDFSFPDDASERRQTKAALEERAVAITRSRASAGVPAEVRAKREG